MTEIVLGPAIRVIQNTSGACKVYSLPIPYQHKDIDLDNNVTSLTKVTEINIVYIIGMRMTYGFYTNKNPFVTNSAALKIARKANQLKYPVYTGKILNCTALKYDPD